MLNYLIQDFCKMKTIYSHWLNNTQKIIKLERRKNKVQSLKFYDSNNQYKDIS